MERICRTYHKLPSEVLNEDMEWIETLIYIIKFDAQRQELEDKRAKLKQENNGRRH